MPRTATRRLQTLQKIAIQNGLQAQIIPEQVATNPKTGNLIKTRSRNTLMVFDERGELQLMHKSGIPRTNNARAEQKLQEYLEQKLQQKATSAIDQSRTISTQLYNQYHTNLAIGVIS